MNKIAISSKKALAVILAVIMLMGSFALSASAQAPEITFDLVPNDGEKSCNVNNIACTAGYAFVDGKCTISISPSASSSPADITDINKPDNVLFYNLTPGTKYTVTVSAELDDGVTQETVSAQKTYTVPKDPKAAPVFNLTTTATTITATSIEGVHYQVEEKQENGTYMIKYAFSANNEFTGLSTGKTYKVSGKYIETPTTLESPVESKEVTLLKDQAKPNAPTLDSRTTTSIKLKSIANGQYRKFTEGMGDEDGWVETVEFTGLTAGTFYSFQQRKKAIPNDSKASPASDTASFKTLLASAGKVPAAVELAEVTQNSFTIKKPATETYEYSKDNGTTWQLSPVFKDLTGGPFDVVQRIVAEEDHEPNPSSAVLKVVLNKADPFKATINDLPAAHFGSKDIYYSKDNTFYAYSIQRTTGQNQWGDIRIIPVTCEIEGEAVFPFAYDKENRYVAKVNPQAAKDYKIIVNYDIQRWNGTGYEKIDGVASNKISFKAVKEPSEFERIMNKIFTFLFTTLPNWIMQGLDFLRKMNK